MIIKDYKLYEIVFMLNDVIYLISNILALIVVTYIGRAYSENFVEQGGAILGV